MAAINAPPIIVSQMEINSGDVFDERSILPKREGLYGHVRPSRSRILDVQNGHGTQKGTRVKTKRLLKKMSSGMHLKKLIFSLQARILDIQALNFRGYEVAGPTGSGACIPCSNAYQSE